MSGDVVELCACDRCAKPVAYDLDVPDDVWGRISPKAVEGWKGGGVLCPECILSSLITSQAAEIERLTKVQAAARARADHLEQTLIGLLHKAMGTKWEHVKTGGKYTILGACRIEATNTPAYIYRSDSDGTVWARPMDEFLDGRFTRTLTNGGENGR